MSENVTVDRYCLKIIGFLKVMPVNPNILKEALIKELKDTF